MKQIVRHLEIFIIAVAIVIVGTVSARAQHGPAPVGVSEVLEREVASGQTFVGTIVPLKRSVVGSAVGGRVSEFPVNEGDRVEKNATLAQLLTETIRAEVEASKAELELRKQELAELENGSRPEEVDQARAGMRAAKARADYARSRNARMEQLFQEGRAVTREQFEETQSQFLSAEQDFLSAKAEYDLLMQGPRKEKIAQAAARLLAQKETTKRLEDQFGKHRMRAPFDGYVIAEHTEVGEWVSSGDPVAEVIALDEVDVEAHVLESQAAYVRRGMSVRVEVPALPREAFTGTVALVVPQADVRSRTFPVKVRVKNRIEQGEPLLMSGMLARVTLPTGPRTKSLLVPKDALVLDSRKASVYVLEPKPDDPKSGTVRNVPVVLGVADGPLIQVTGDLKQGQQVVVQGNERLQPGSAVVVTRVLEPGAIPKSKAIQSNPGGDPPRSDSPSAERR